MYKINPLKYNGVTVIPSEIAEKHLILSSASQLKVIIFAYSRSGGLFSEEECSLATGISKEEVADALSYWKDMGFVLLSEECPVSEAASQAITAPTVTENTVKPAEAVFEIKTAPSKVPSNNPSKLTYNEICTRITESADVRLLLNEAQMKLGRTIGTGDQSSLILLHDYYGLPVEVILTICEYARTKGKSTNTNYIYKIGVDWSMREIDTIERADEELKNIEKVNSLWAEFSVSAGIRDTKPTSSQEKYLSQWSGEWKFNVPMLVLAFEEMKTHTGKISYSYMHKVLSAWHNKGIDTPEKVVEQQEKFMKEKEQKAYEKSSLKNRASKTNTQPETDASYDIERAEQLAKTSVPKVIKREKR